MQASFMLFIIEEPMEKIWYGILENKITILTLIENKA